MKILIICSKVFYDKIPPIAEKLQNDGHTVVMPNCFDCPETESTLRGTDKHSAFKAAMFKRSEETIKNLDAVLVLNFDKNGESNYIGGATFLEMYDAFRFGKKIFLYNGLPNGMLTDEIIGFSPIMIDGDLNLVK